MFGLIWPPHHKLGQLSRCQCKIPDIVGFTDTHAVSATASYNLQKILTTLSILTEAPTSDHTDLLQVNLVQTVLVGVAEGLRFIDPEFINEEERADTLPALLQNYFMWKKQCSIKY